MFRERKQVRVEEEILSLLNKQFSPILERLSDILQKVSKPSIFEVYCDSCKKETAHAGLAIASSAMISSYWTGYTHKQCLNCGKISDIPRP